MYDFGTCDKKTCLYMFMHVLVENDQQANTYL